MRLLRHLTRQRLQLPPLVVAVGSFEGVHRGHQAILRRAIDLAAQVGGSPAALILIPSAANDSFAGSAGGRIDSLRQRLLHIAQVGVETMLLERTAEPSMHARLASIVAADVRIAIVVVCVAAGSTVVGSDDVQTLRTLGQRHGFSIEIVSPPLVDGRQVTTIDTQQAILTGDLPRVRLMLGRDLSVIGRVRRGFQRGRTIGFPTANLRTRGVALPPNGVYVVRVRVGEDLYGGVANLGINPTFGGNQRTLESYLFDYAGDLYGRRIEVHLLQSLREERKFAGIDELKEQIRRDAEMARAVLEAL